MRKFKIYLLLFFSIVVFSFSQENKVYDIVFLIDNSGSIGKLDIDLVYSFIDNLKENTNIGIVSFGEEVRILYPLQSIIKEKIKDVLNEMDFKEKYTDLNSGLNLSLKEFSEKSRKDSSKILILITDGIIDIKDKKIITEKLEEEIKEKIITEFKNQKINIYSILCCKKGANFPLIKKLTEGTKGNFFIYIERDDLKDAFEKILGFIEPKISEGVSTEKRVEEKKDVLTFVIVGLLILTLFLSLSTFIKLKKPNFIYREKPKEPVENLLISIFDNLEKLKETFTNSALSIDNLSLDINDYVLKRRKEVDELKEGYYGFLGQIFYFMDFLEDLSNNEKNREILTPIYNKMEEILKKMGIKEIKVQRGDKYNPDYHYPVSTKYLSEFDEGIILDIVKKGYMKSEKIILRKAEVVINKKTI